MHNPADISIFDFTYELPQEKIAQYPLQNRDESKLLIWQKGEIKEDQFKSIADYISPDSLLVFNTTRVVNARLHFLNSKKQDIELFCLGPDDQTQDPSQAMQRKSPVLWRCFVGSLKRWKEAKLRLERSGLLLEAEMRGKKNDYVIIEFSWSSEDLSFSEILGHFGEVPIPPYMNRESDMNDKNRYQTIYAAQEGSVAAPTAGLHFTPAVIDSLQQKSVTQLTVTLHVGAGTFKPVKSETMQGHEMHAEWMEVSRETIEVLSQGARKVIAVGTTSLRTIESLYWMGLKAAKFPESEIDALEIKQWDAYKHDGDELSLQQSLGALLNWMKHKEMQSLVCNTQILIAPPYKLKVANGLITNFHQPQSTLLLLVASILGEKWKEVYQYALSHGFRFLSYGDSSLLLK